MPVFPDVASPIVVRPGSIRPWASAASIIATPIRSFTLPAGLYASSLAISSAPQPGARRVSRRSGVPPTRSATLSGRSTSRGSGSGVVRARLIVPRLLAGRELEVVLGREGAGLAEADDDLVVRLHDVSGAVRDLLPVHPRLEHEALAGAVGAELRGRERHAPDREELTELERIRLDGLHVHHAAVVVRVERGQELALLVDPDVGGHGLALAVGEDGHVRVDVEDRVARIRQPQLGRALLEPVGAVAPRARGDLEALGPRGLRALLRAAAARERDDRHDRGDDHDRGADPDPKQARALGLRRALLALLRLALLAALLLLFLTACHG